MTYAQLLAQLNSVYRDSAAYGVPASGEHEPIKAEIRALLALMLITMEDGGFDAPPTWAADLAAIQSQMEAIDGAEGYADAAAASAAAADADRVSAEAAAGQAIAAAEAAGPTFFYDTKAAMTAAIGSITADAVAEVFADEDHDGHRTRYRKESGVLVFKVDLDKPWYINSTITLSADSAFGRVEFGPSGELVTGAHDAAITEVIDTRRVGIFDDSGGGVITVLSGFVRPEWWGDIEDTIIKAHDALPATGGIIELAARRYKPNAFEYATAEADAVYIKKPNVWIKGAGRPSVSDDCRTLEGGSVIEGYLLMFADNLTTTDFGVDHGRTVTDDVMSGADGDAYAFTFASQEQKDDLAWRAGGYSNNIVGLCASPTDGDHAVIVAEGVVGRTADNMLGVYGLHPLVNKAQNTRGKNWQGWGGGAELCIFKTDGAGISEGVEIDGLTLYRDAPGEFTPHTTAASNPIGLNLNPDAGDLVNVRISNFSCFGEVSYAVIPSVPGSGGGDIIGCEIDGIYIDGADDAGIALITAGSSTVDIKLRNTTVKNTPVGVYDGLPSGSVVDLGDIHATACGVAAGFAGDGATVADTSFGRIVAENCTAGAVRLNFGAAPLPGSVVLKGSTPRVFATDGSGVFPALAGTWANVGGADAFQATYAGGKVTLKGLVVPGATTTVATLPVGLRPSVNKRCIAQGNNGAVLAGVGVTVATTGDVVVNEQGGGTANCSTWLSLEGVSWEIG